MAKMGWIFPGATGAQASYSSNIQIDVIKPQYYSLDDTAGTLTLQDEATYGIYGYTSANVADIKKYSTQQFVTISGHIEGFLVLAGDSTKTTNFTNTLVSFLQSNGLTGIEIDFEHFNKTVLTTTAFSTYTSFMNTFGTTLHNNGFKLMIDGPAIGDSTDQGNYNWTWESFDTLAVDYLCPLVYDRQYDYGTTSPITPLTWLTNVCNWMKSKITDTSRIVPGIPAYGYYGPSSSFTITSNSIPYSTMTTLTGFSTATRDSASQELTWTTGGNTYWYCDGNTMNAFKSTIYATGLSNFSVWWLGGSNPYPSNDSSTGGITLTNAGVNMIRDSMRGISTDKISYVALGTGTIAPTAADTRLGAETFRKPVSSYTNGAGLGEVIITCYLSPSDSITTINEIGFFGGNATAAANSGTLLARALYSHTHSGTESIQFNLDFSV